MLKDLDDSSRYTQMGLHELAAESGNRQMLRVERMVDALVAELRSDKAEHKYRMIQAKRMLDALIDGRTNKDLITLIEIAKRSGYIITLDDGGHWKLGTSRLTEGRHRN